MYNTIYTVPFTNVDGESYEVQIKADGASVTPTELVGGTPPFVVDIDDNDFLYNPTRFSGATLKLVGSDYLQSLYSTQYQKYKVNLIKNNSVVWTGFITPELYSQDYDNSLFELEIECISALSTLEYIDFAHTASTISFKELIKKCITESNGDYKAVYVPSVYTTSLDSITVSCANFIDEDNKPMTLKECLEEVCKFLNWTCTEYDGNVYFIDVDYIKAGKTAYTDYLTDTSVTLSSSITVNDIKSKGNENKLSILGGYNKVTVIDSDYELDSDQIFPKLYDCKDTGLGSQTRDAGKDGKAIEKDGDKYKNGFYRYFYKYWQSNSFDCIAYKYSSGSWVEDSTNNLYSAGARIMEQAQANQEDKPTSLNWTTMFEVKLFDGQTVDKNKLLDGWAVPLVNNQMPDISQLLKPTIKLKKSSGIIAFPSDAYLGIKYQMALIPEINSPQFRGVPEYMDHKDDTMKGMGINDFDEHKNYYFIPMRIQIGNKYWNGSQWTTNSNAVVRVLADVAKDTHLEGKWISNKNTNTYDKGVDELGDAWVIPLTSGLVGELNITLFVPYYETNRSKAYIYIKDLSVDVCRSESPYTRKKEKQDTKYSNVVNGDYINEAEDIKFKITSKNDSKVAYSKAIINGAWLDTLTNNIDGTAEKPEKYLIQRIVNQYQSPKLKLLYIIKPSVLPYSVVKDNYINGKSFIFIGGRVDYENNSIECNLIEI